MSNQNSDKEEMKRSCVAISRQLDNRLKKYIPFGQQEQVMRELLEVLASTCEKINSNAAIWAILDGRARIEFDQFSNE